MSDTTQERQAEGGIHYGAAPEVKRRHRAMWALGDYPTVAADLVTPLGHVLVDACRVARGDRVLDIAAGTGTVAIPAARVGARVTASDLTPELLAAGERLARTERLDVTWEEADAESLPHPDGAFDVTTSCLGVMFAPFHQAAADELVRVTRPDGRIGLVSWTPEGFIGELFATMGPYAPPPPPGSQPATLWGAPDHVRGLLGTGSTTWRPPGRTSWSTGSRTARPSVTTSRAATGRPSPSTARWPTRPTASPPWMPPSPTSATGTSPVAPWPGSTCCSPPAVAEPTTPDAGDARHPRAPRHPSQPPGRGRASAPSRGCRCGSLRSAA
jgi:SAM-dependent methyltransferase